MCGIAGIVAPRGEPADEALLWRMIRMVPYRGPDESGVHVAGGAGLAHARLSIIDLSGGKQPMSNEDGTLWVTFNGEIFNYIELRRELEGKHRFKTSSDTEVIVHAFEEWGEDCVRRFNGQWSFALWDEKSRTLFASRDRLGVRPLYYTRTPRRFAFASEVKSLFALPEVERAIDPRGLDQILTFWSTVPPRTPYRGIDELPAGHNLIWRDGTLTVRRYWQLDYQPDESRSEESWAEELRALLIDSVRLRLRADVPVAAYLSGGLDSTVITSMVKTFTETPLRTFSVAFEDPDFDESKWQRKVVEHLGVKEHSEVLCRVADIGRHFPEVVWHGEQPLVRTAPVPLFLLSRLVRQNDYKVVLTGEGSDEMMGGYDIFKEAKVRRFWARQPQSTLRPKLLRKLYPYLPNLQAQSDAYLKAFFFARPEDLGSPFFSHLPRWELTAKLKAFYAAEHRKALAGHDSYADLAARLPEGYAGWDPFCQAQYLESTYLLGGYLLSSQGDRVGMANSIEGRFPFLDVRVVELAARMPPRVKMKVLDEKHVLKRAAGELIPPFLRTRPKQPYRASDVPAFFDPSTRRARFEYVDELLERRALEQAGIWNPDAVARLVDKAKTGNVIGVKDGMALVAILSTQLLHEHFVRHLSEGRPAHA